MESSTANIRLRVYDEDGAALTGGLMVNETTGSASTDGVYAETITTLDDCGFVVSWCYSRGGAITERYDAFAQVHNADGKARTSEFEVNIATLSNQSKMAPVAECALADGPVGSVELTRSGISEEDSPCPDGAAATAPNSNAR
ncbi:hypothetical protein KO516_22685 [Citreicella sp. C3M06]|uniref:hypothetical protein n=1 Tax=Citreicella sp. C3M06 TaxID=2841564 RepID=UPI001C097DE5|nr:hypothetical protein [Citreicella sp. C3M06]MBU2963583.1 hypothetical protein [Citreicella sp. C3M06]